MAAVRWIHLSGRHGSDDSVLEMGQGCFESLTSSCCGLWIRETAYKVVEAVRTCEGGRRCLASRKLDRRCLVNAVSQKSIALTSKCLSRSLGPSVRK